MKKAMLAWVALSALSTAHAQDTLKKLKDTGVLTMGVRESSGLSYTVGSGKFVGYHIDVCTKVVTDLEKQLGRKIEVKYQPVTSQNRLPLVRNGTVDLECGSTTHSKAREKDVAFAVTTFVEEVRMAVKAQSGIESLKQLANKTVAVTTGTTTVQTLRRHRQATGLDFKEVYGKDHADSFLLLESGRADAFIMDSSILAKNIASSKNPGDYKITGEVLSVEPIAIVLRKDDPAFKKAVDDSIKAQMASGELAKTYDRWFMQPIPPAGVKIGLPLNQATRDAWAHPNDKPLEDYARP